MKPKERLTPDQRRQMILDAALRIVNSQGWEAVTREAVSDEARIAVGTINYAYSTMDNLRDEVMKHAIEHSDDDTMLTVIAKGLATGNEVARNAPTKVKTAALKLLM
jgi:DNA-binding transcriptional regulator YbjK